MPIDQMTLRPHSLHGAGWDPDAPCLPTGMFALRVLNTCARHSASHLPTCARYPRPSDSQKNFGAGFPEDGHFSPCLTD